MDWAKISLGEYELSNNIWGKGSIEDYSQCIFKGVKTESGAQTHMGWSWNWPKSINSVKAYPSILYGRKPWNNYSTSPHLPIAIDRLRELTVSYSTRTEANGAVNLLLESWITSGADARPRERRGELAIHLYQKNWPGQAGDFIESITIDNIRFDFYLDKNMRVPGDNHTWAYYGFVHRGKPLLRAKLDIIPFVDYLVRNGYVDRNHFLATVELGNEVNWGKGETIIEHFFVDVASLK